MGSGLPRTGLRLVGPQGLTEDRDHDRQLTRKMRLSIAGCAPSRAFREGASRRPTPSDSA